MRSAAGNVMSIGFSTTTCFPASRAATARSACKPLGVQIVTASMSSRARSSAMSSVDLSTPYLAAILAAFSGSVSAIATSSAVSLMATRHRQCTSPMTPAPMTANLTLVLSVPVMRR